MANSYFEYALSFWKHEGIASISGVFPTKTKLIEAAKRSIFDASNITSDRFFLESIRNYLNESDLGQPRTLSNDAKIVFDRCWDNLCTLRRRMNSGELFCYNFMCEAMIDCCWLLSSLQETSYEKSSID